MPRLALKFRWARLLLTCDPTVENGWLGLEKHKFQPYQIPSFFCVRLVTYGVNAHPTWFIRWEQMDRQLPTLEWVNNREMRVWARVHTTSLRASALRAGYLVFVTRQHCAPQYECGGGRAWGFKNGNWYYILMQTGSTIVWLFGLAPLLHSLLVRMSAWALVCGGCVLYPRLRFDVVQKQARNAY